MKQCMRPDVQSNDVVVSSALLMTEEEQARARQVDSSSSKHHSLLHGSKYPSELFTPYRVREVELANRIVVPPMCMYSASEDGLMSHFHQFQYSEYAVGGVGLIIFEATAVSPIGRLSNGDLGIYNEANIPLLRSLNDFIHNNTKAKTGVQLGHGGRKAGWTKFPWAGDYRPLSAEEGGWQPIGPSALPYNAIAPMPREMTFEDIEEVKLQFAEGARRAIMAGFDVIEIHGAHGYLLNEFLSPITNHRTDMYGGSRENRFRFVKEVCAVVRDVIPLGTPLAIRLSAVEWVEGGLELDDTIALCSQLKELGVDVFDISTGGNSEAQKIPAKPGFQVPFATAVKDAVPGCTVIAAGMITEPEQAELYVMKAQTDLVAVGREMLRNPRWPKLAAHRLGADTAMFTPPQHACIVRSRT